MQKLIILLIIASSLFGCMSIKSTVENNKIVSIDNGIDFELMQPRTYGKKIGITQVAEILSNGDVHELIFQTQIKNNSITVVGFLPNGARLFLIEYDGMNIKSEGYSKIIEGIKPKYLLADLQLSLWPYQVIMSEGFSNSKCIKIKKCSFVDRDNENGIYLRTLKVANKNIIDIRYEQSNKLIGRIDFQHFSRNYQIKLELIEILELDE